MSWQMGVAFIRGINIYGSKRISQNKMLELCMSIEDEGLRIIKVVKTDNIIFEKRKMHYTTVSSRLERVLSDYFGEPYIRDFEKHENNQTLNPAFETTSMRYEVTVEFHKDFVMSERKQNCHWHNFQASKGQS